ncbi:hypothetical protein EKH77_02735 [Streptomyces luteoverticillatus]|uniref:Uncharacterized protein n=1 Tax=Streptomyces luteoverticillatus TaxID=66425 RepID=A0A3S9PD26_STRLT|nr:hypothetical protein [Streptomyces luteoverticillatus]AZQ70273.1 hypothetical protein EKH77_02735 [Streptomyces luteoverticillatus]
MIYRFNCNSTPGDYLAVSLDTDGDIAFAVHEQEQTPRMVYLDAGETRLLMQVLADLAERATRPQDGQQDHKDVITEALNREGLALERDTSPTDPEPEPVAVSPSDTVSLPLLHPVLTTAVEPARVNTETVAEPIPHAVEEAVESGPCKEGRNLEQPAAAAATIGDVMIPQPVTVNAERAYLRARELLRQGDTPFTHAAVLDLARYLAEAA